MGDFTFTMNAQVFVDGDQGDVQLFEMCDTADADLDGICDEEDDCVGLYDACGVCNGLDRKEIVDVTPFQRGLATATATN